MQCRSCNSSTIRFGHDPVYNLAYKYLGVITTVGVCSNGCGTRVFCKLCGEDLYSGVGHTRFIVLKYLIMHLMSSLGHSLPIIGNYIFINPRRVWLLSYRGVDLVPIINLHPQLMFLLGILPDDAEVNDDNIEDCILRVDYECILCKYEFESFPSGEIFFNHFTACVADKIFNQTK